MGGNRHFADWLITSTEQGIGALLGTRECMLLTIEVEDRPNAHGPVLMQEVVAAALLDAEQQVKESRQGGRFACLVEAEHDVQVRAIGRLGAEIDAFVGKLAVASEV
ncbi:hypothetical protein D9M68_917870 [compost metagenome]